jgi:hypothetical protein
LAPAPKRVKGAVDVAPPERRPAEDCAAPAPVRPLTPKPPGARPNGIHASWQFAPAGQLSP